MHHTKIWGGHGPLAPPFPTPMICKIENEYRLQKLIVGLTLIF